MEPKWEFEDISSSSGNKSVPEYADANNNKIDFDRIVNESSQTTDSPEHFKCKTDGINIDENFSLNDFSNNNKNKQKKDRTLHTALNIILSTVLIISILCSGSMFYIGSILNDARYNEDFSDNHENLGISSDVIKELPKEIVNIALFGIDSRSRVTEHKPNKSIQGRSDAIIILSINTDKKTLKMTSVLRDSWLYVDGSKHRGYNKVNAAYAYGGPELAVKTLNQNFDLNITDYVSVSLHQLWKVIDFMGGVDIHITEAERKELNRLSNSEGFGVKRVEKTGLVHLDGGQAMTYARIRHIDSDGIRAKRQQKVLNCLLQKAKEMPPTQYPSLLEKILANVETSLSYKRIMDFSSLLSVPSLALENTSVPGEQVIGRGGIFDDTRGGWVWKYDVKQARDYIHEWIYGEVKIK